MSNTATDLVVKVYGNKRVVTFKDIDHVHGRVEGTAARNFRANRSRFVENIDYYRVLPSYYRKHFGYMDPRQTNSIIILTESGYSCIVKSLRDETAWAIQHQMVNEYFRGGSYE